VAITVLAILLAGTTLGLRLFLTGAVAVLLVATNVYFTLRPFLETEAPLPAHMGAPLVKLATFDTVNDESLPSFRKWVGDKKAAPDIIALQNVSNPWRTAAQQISETYPYRASALHGEIIKEELLSRFPILSAQVFHPAGQRTALAAVVLFNGVPFRVIVMAPNKASNSERWAERNQYMGLVAQWASNQSRRGEPLTIVGDWNVTPWSPAYRSFLETTGLVPAIHQPLPPTTHHLTLLPFMGPSDDHIAVSQKLGVRSCETGPDLGADHIPVVCQLAVR
jgi:endonuclease/exonuclease/phosphatase (EEP) superfamily protein YafD